MTCRMVIFIANFFNQVLTTGFFMNQDYKKKLPSQNKFKHMDLNYSWNVRIPILLKNGDSELKMYKFNAVLTDIYIQQNYLALPLVNRFTIPKRTTEPKSATRKLVKLNPVTPCSPNWFMTNPPINAPIIPTAMLANAPIDPSFLMIMLATQPANAPRTIHDKIPILIPLSVINF